MTTVSSLIRWIQCSSFTKLQKNVVLAVACSSNNDLPDMHVRNDVLWNQKVTNVDSIVNSIQKLVIGIV